MEARAEYCSPMTDALPAILNAQRDASEPMTMADLVERVALDCRIGTEAPDVVATRLARVRAALAKLGKRGIVSGGEAGAAEREGVDRIRARASVLGKRSTFQSYELFWTNDLILNIESVYMIRWSDPAKAGVGPAEPRSKDWGLSYDAKAARIVPITSSDHRWPQ